MKVLDFIGSDGYYRFNTTLDTDDSNATYTFDVRWNLREKLWHMDMYDPSGVLMVAGVAIVLNIPLGRRSAHPFFERNAIVALNNSLDNKEEPGFDDIGTRVEIVHMTVDELVALTVNHG